MASTPKPAGPTTPIRRMPWLARYPESVAWDQVFTPATIPALFDSAIETYGPKTCCVFSGRTTTYAEIGTQVEAFAAGLAKIGIGKDTRVGLLLPNSPTYLVAFFATLKLGAVVVNYNPLYTSEELAHQIKDSGTELLVTLDLKPLFDKVEALIANGALPRAVVMSFASLLPASKSVLFKLFRGKDLAHPMRSPVAAKLVLEQVLLDNDGSYVKPTIDPRTLAVLQYTGGTTGLPKGAMLSHANLTINVRQTAAWSAKLLKPGEERILGVLPFFHVFAMTGIVLFGISEGAEIIIQPRFVLDETVQLIAKAKPTVMPGVPTLFAAIAGHKGVASLDLRSLKMCLSGGAPLPLEVSKSFEALTGAKLVEAYGLSETSPGVTCNPLDGRAKAGSIGQPLPGTTVAIRDPVMPERDMPLGQAGEICIKGPQVMSGYWKQEQATHDAFVGDYFRTGDIGYMDTDGFIFIVDRIKDMIICSGFKVYPRHIEEKIYEHPAVDEVTVIGIRDEYRGEAPKAFIKLKPGTSATTDEIHQHLTTRLSKIEMPAAIEFRAVLPKTVIGKLSKKELKAEEDSKSA